MCSVMCKQGWEISSAIAFRNLTVYLSESSQYLDARFYAIQSAVDLYGACTPEVEACTDAWYAVGVGPAYSNTVIADFEASPDSIFCSAPVTVDFTNLSVNAFDFEWDFGDGSPVSTASSPSHTYTDVDSFTVSLIADGRGMTRDEVHRVAQGRVWLGDVALKHGLVDRIAGLDDAIASAAIPSSLPVKPKPSVVVALTFT